MPTRIEKAPVLDLSEDHAELLSALNAHGVKYLLVGGYAVGIHAQPRATKDLDVYIRTDPENSHAVFNALAIFGAPLSGLHPEDFNDRNSYFQMGRPPEQIDILQVLSGVEFDEAWECRIHVLVNGKISVPVISADKLITNKIASGRLQDLADVESLQKAMRARKIKS